MTICILPDAGHHSAILTIFYIESLLVDEDIADRSARRFRTEIRDLIGVMRDRRFVLALRVSELIFRKQSGRLLPNK